MAAKPPFARMSPPQSGTPITIAADGRVRVPDDPIIPFIEGDGTGPDIWRASVRAFDAAVAKCYGGSRKVHWFEIYAGEKAQEKLGEYLPEDTVAAVKEYVVAIKGPLTTPVGGGIRSLNVALRQILDLYACVRPVRYFQGVPSPLVHPEKLDVVIYRENTEDVYAGIEWPAKSPETAKLIRFLKEELGKSVREDSGIGIKPISETGSKKLARKAIRFALEKKRRSVTFMHKGNIMKFTEGAFKTWGYEVAKAEFADVTITEAEVMERHGGKVPAGRLLVNDRIADSMFQQVLLRPEEYDVIATPNLNGDYLSDACAAQVGGLGMAPGGNIGDGYALFEATHGTAPKYAGQDKVNPSSLILSGVMMFDYLGWTEVAETITRAMERTIASKKVTYDLERLMQNATLLKCSEFATALIQNM